FWLSPLSFSLLFPYSSLFRSPFSLSSPDCVVALFVRLSALTWLPFSVSRFSPVLPPWRVPMVWHSCVQECSPRPVDCRWLRGRPWCHRLHRRSRGAAVHVAEAAPTGCRISGLRAHGEPRMAGRIVARRFIIFGA